MRAIREDRFKYGRPGAQSGFTLLELMVGIAVAAIAMTAMYALYNGLQKSSVSQVQVATMQQNLRGALNILERDIRATGMDRTYSGNFGIIDVRRRLVTTPGVAANPDPAGSPALIVTADQNDDGVLDANETLSYLRYDQDNDGFNDLARGGTNATGRALLAENIEAFGFAYAYDADNDGWIERSANGNIIWAVDADNDGDLDTRLDINDDGSIDLNDVGGLISQDTNGDGIDDLRDVGAALGTTVQPQQILAVQIWVLARSNRPDPKIWNTQQYVVGDRIIGPMNDNIKRRLLSEVVQRRNL